jgi:hypothetical protein
MRSAWLEIVGPKAMEAAHRTYIILSRDSQRYQTSPRQLEHCQVGVLPGGLYQVTIVHR